ncbi:ABC transporter permease [Phytoactinopolyspora halotolerans]|uniref:ABC transporter permease n=1 Tax=Phytoactinopolyspora halotolerans TaxID=1981512 RepID=A0A6L9S5V1_9ACTN|nr:ABC transporter permease [Phytoactinopolyspora halotolerans]NEE00469.1 ABC transporter permease [Phytoactinopolyspora halotolerans]
MAVTSPPGSATLSPAPLAGSATRWSSFRRRLTIWISGSVVALLVITCYLGPFVLPIPSPVGGNVLDSGLSPGSPGHPLGTDVNGNDVLSRLIHGGRSSLTVGVVVNIIGLAIGGTVGAISAYLGGRADSIIMRALDVLIAFPSLVLVIVLAQILGPSLPNTILALSAFSIPAVARISRAATLKVMSMPYLQAAELSGSPWWRILSRHVVPNIVPQLTTFAMLGMAIVVVTEGALSFLGLGIPPPRPSWGNMIFEAQQSMSATPLLVLWPSIALLVTVLSFNLLGESIRDEVTGR